MMGKKRKKTRKNNAKAVLIEEGLPKAPGEFKLNKNIYGNIKTLSFMCPCGCGSIAGISITQDQEEYKAQNPLWLWDGNKEQPTTKPSIRRIGGCGWHGYLTKGEFVEC